MMKQFLYLIFFAILGVSTQAQEISWMSFNEAIAAQEKNRKPIFIDVYTNWCGPCKMLDNSTFVDPAVVKHINANYNAVKFNAEGNESIVFKGKDYGNARYDAARVNSRNATHQFTTYLNIQAYPSMVILGVDGSISKNILGYRAADRLLAELK